MIRTLAITLTLACAALANADITASLVNMGPQGSGTNTYDVVVSITDTPGVGPDDWTACGMTATLTGCCSFVNNEPFNPPCFPAGHDMWDSFFASPECFPCVPELYVRFVDPDAVVEDPQLRFGEWYDTTDTGNGWYVVHRLTVLCDDPCEQECWLHVEFETAAANSGGTLFPFTWDVLVCIPEPASLGMLALGGLTLIRRR